jgi:poly(3-hydroxybutyrate) depolymerase
MRNLVVCLLVYLTPSAFSQTIHLQGVVSDRSDAPVIGTIVALKSAGLRDTTGADGGFRLDRDALSAIPSPHRARLSVVGGDLVVVLGAPVPLAVEIFDPAGSLLRSRVFAGAGIGEHRIRLLDAGAPNLALLIRVTAGSQVSILRTATQEVAGETWFPTADEAARGLAVVDTLLVSATGFAPVRLPVASYDQRVDVVLDSIPKAVRSAGCDKTRTLADGTLSIASGGKTRKYILKTPASYDRSQAHRLVFAFAESGSSAQSVANRNYFRMGTYDTKGTIFVAPDAENGAGSWSKADVTLVDDILAQVENGLCVDKSRIFATGFSFGGAMSLALACTRADVFRGVAFFSGADLTGSCTTAPTKPIAYYASQASCDASGPPIPTSGRIKQAQFAAVNGCTAEPNSTTFPAAGKPHTCTVYKNCKAGFPTVYCVFDGPHGWEPVDPGQSTSWNPVEAWKFIGQF